MTEKSGQLKEAIEVLKDAEYIGSAEYVSEYDKRIKEAIDTVVEWAEKTLLTDEKIVCPECLKQCTNEELKMFGGLCEECSTDFN
jgi:uncharacterized CHY-type Zn-finger protein